jgi:hypothetical protein
MLASVYRYWGRQATEEAVAARIYNPAAAGTLPGMLVADARAEGWAAAFGPGHPEDWRRALAAGVPVILLQTGTTSSHLVLLQGWEQGRWLVNDGSGRITWRRADALSPGHAISVYVWPDDYGFDPPALSPHDRR